MLRLRAIAAVSVALAGISAATSPVADAVPASRSSKINVTIKVADCEGCLLGPRYVRESGYWAGPDLTVVGGKVTFQVPRKYARGLSIVVNDLDEVQQNAEIYAVIRYAGKRPGSKVSAGDAAGAEAGYPCWGGTSKKKVTLRMQVDRFPYTDEFSGESGMTIRPYFTRTLPSFGTPLDAFSGTVGSQDAFVCP